MGVHKPTTTTNPAIFFTLKNGVAIYGGFAGIETTLNQRDWQTNITVLSGDIDNNDITDVNGVVTRTTNIQGNNSYHVVFSSDLTETVILDGFTLTAGKARGSGSNIDGGGLYNWASSSLILTNIIFSGNSSTAFSGGMYNVDSSPTLNNVTFRGNLADSGGGMSNWAGSNPTLTNVIFINNVADTGGGGIYNRNSSPTLINVTFINNSAIIGGGIASLDQSNLSLTNVTFTGNSAIVGGGIYNRGSYPNLTIAILWGNTATDIGPQIANFNNSAPSISYSDIEGSGGSGTGWNATLGQDNGGNIEADPLFIDVDGADNILGTLDDNLRLQTDSPVIDAGNNLSITVPTDLDGDPRLVDIPTMPDTGNGSPPLVDMGAYETQLTTYEIYLPMIQVADTP
jgi:predicted outer membrane repeat protein